MNYVELLLQLIPWTSQAKGTSGETWAYSNRRPQAKASIFGDDTVNATVSRLQKGVKQVTESNDELVTVWFNDVNDEEVLLYKEEYGEVAYLSDENELISKEEYLKRTSNDSVASEDSEQPFAQ